MSGVPPPDVPPDVPDEGPPPPLKTAAATATAGAAARSDAGKAAPARTPARTPAAAGARRPKQDCEPIIVVKNLRNAFGDAVIHEDLDLTVCRGEMQRLSCNRC